MIRLLGDLADANKRHCNVEEEEEEEEDDDDEEEEEEEEEEEVGMMSFHTFTAPSEEAETKINEFSLDLNFSSFNSSSFSSSSSASSFSSSCGGSCKGSLEIANPFTLIHSGEKKQSQDQSERERAREREQHTTDKQKRATETCGQEVQELRHQLRHSKYESDKQKTHRQFKTARKRTKRKEEREKTGPWNLHIPPLPNPLIRKPKK
jgi:hypothetical protein